MYKFCNVIVRFFFFVRRGMCHTWSQYAFSVMGGVLCIISLLINGSL